MAWMGNIVVLFCIWAGDWITPMPRNQVRAWGTAVADFWKTVTFEWVDLQGGGERK